MNPTSTARVAGLAYLVIMIAAPFSEMFVRGGAIVGGDPASSQRAKALRYWLQAFRWSPSLLPR